MEKIISPNLIMSNLNRLGFHCPNKKVLSYFLTKNFKCIFGTSEFEVSDVDEITTLNYSLDCSTGDNSQNKMYKFSFTDLGTKYEINCTCDGNIEMIKENSPTRFKIECNQNVMKNTVVNMLQEETTVEYQHVYFNPIPTFDYQKIKYDNDGDEILSPAYRVKPIGSITQNSAKLNIEILSNPNESCLRNLQIIYNQLEQSGLSYIDRLYYFLKEAIIEIKKAKTVISIPIGYEYDTIYDYLSQIYDVLEEKCEISDLVLKNKKLR